MNLKSCTERKVRVDIETLCDESLLYLVRVSRNPSLLNLLLIVVIFHVNIFVVVVFFYTLPSDLKPLVL